MNSGKICRLAGLLALALLSAGCSGQYTLTVPEQVAPAGGEVTMVARLQRSEVWKYLRPAKESAIRFQIEQGLTRGAFTDELGYAAAAMPVPAQPGVYHVNAGHIDRDGKEVQIFTPIYVWDPLRPVLAVDMDSVTFMRTVGSNAARDALVKLAADYNIMYVTDQPVLEHKKLHSELESGGFPDGPMILWQNQKWQIARDGKFNMPRVVMEDRLVSSLPAIRKAFPAMEVGIAHSTAAAEAFIAAGMKCVMVSPDPMPAKVPAGSVRRTSWHDVTAKGL